MEERENKLQQIYELSYDFVNEGRILLRLNKKGGWCAKHFAELPSGMLRYCPQPHHLPLHESSGMNEGPLVYDVSGKRPINRFLDHQNLSIRQFYDWLYQIAGVLERSANLMLSEQRFILHPDLIFEDTVSGQIFLVYLPLRQVEDKPEISEEMKQLVLRLVSALQQQQEEDYIHEWYADMEAERFPLTQFHKLMEKYNRKLALQQELQGSDAVHEQPSERHKAEAPASDTNRGEQQALDMDSIKQRTKRWQHWIHNVLSRGSARLTLKFTAAILLSPPFILIPVYFSHKGMIDICAGLLLLLWDCIFFAADVKGLRGRSERSSKRSMKETPSIAKYYEQLPQYTRLIGTPDRTVLLASGEASAGFDTVPEEDCIGVRPLLIVEESGQERVIEIEEQHFVIGRGPEGVDYRENSPGVSRVHAEVVQLDRYRCGIKDLDSKNGTFLGNTRLVPFQIYPLQNGTTIRLGPRRYRYQQYS